MDFTVIAINFVYAGLGGIMTLIFMYAGYRLFDKATHFDTAKELAKGNQAVGLVVLGIFLGVGVAIGLVIGMGLN
ncbi:MAG: DUF350 domain-containing protein [bacterium]|nr:DUF350 domain-containing protein [bacterium]